MRISSCIGVARISAAGCLDASKLAEPPPRDAREGRRDLSFVTPGAPMIRAR